MIQDHPVGIRVTEHPEIPAPERLHLIGRGFRYVARRDDFAVGHGQNTHSGRLLAGGDPDRVQQIEVSVRAERGKGSLRANDHQGFSRAYRQIKKEGGLFKRVGTLDPDDPINIGPARGGVQKAAELANVLMRGLRMRPLVVKDNLSDGIDFGQRGDHLPARKGRLAA